MLLISCRAGMRQPVFPAGHRRNYPGDPSHMDISAALMLQLGWNPVCPVSPTCSVEWHWKGDTGKAYAGLELYFGWNHYSCTINFRA